MVESNRIEKRSAKVGGRRKRGKIGEPLDEY